MEENILEITIESYAYFEDDEYVCGEYLIVNGDRIKSDGYHLKAILSHLGCDFIGNLDMNYVDGEEDLEDVLVSLGYDVIVNRI